MSRRLFELLRERMAAESVGPGEPVTIAELHKRLLPYHACRDALAFATKAEYDAELLDLLADDERIDVAESALVEAVRKESRQPEPGLGFLHRFSASEIRLKSTQPVPPPDPPLPSSAAAGCRACGRRLPEIRGARYCPDCGTDQVIPTCSGCGTELGEDWRYCALCGILVDCNP